MSQKNKKNKSELLDFNLTIKKKDNNIYIYVLDLNLFAKGKNIEIAMINLHNQFEKLKINYQNFPELSIERKNSNIKFNNYNLKEEMKLFFLKFAIISILFVFAGSLGVTIISNKVSQISLIEILKSQKDTLKAYLVKSENNMDQFKETMIFIKPYISEIKKLIIN